MSILVTGAAGFIGCNNVLALNRRGVTDIIAVDNLEKSEKFLNLAQCRISDYFDKRDFIARVRAGTAPKPEAIFHQGACSDTMEQDGVYMMENNYRYTLDLYRWAQSLHIPFIYASSAATYGAKTTFREELEFEGPLNVYGYSKFLFDQVLRREFDYLRAPVIGLRYFNVYGPHEQHKGRMASVAFHQYFQYRRTGKVKLFEGCLGYGNGEQLRDFVYIDDVTNVLMHFLDHPVSGIYNCGTGRAQPCAATKGRTRSRSPKPSPRANSSTSTSPKRSRASIRPTPRPTSPSFAQAAATFPSAASKKASRPTWTTFSKPIRTWKPDAESRLS